MPAAKTITSLTNDRVKAIRALENRKERRETGLFVAEGLSVLISAREAGQRPQTLVVQKGAELSGRARDYVDWNLRSGAEVLEVTAQIQEKLAQRDNPLSLIAVFAQVFASAPAPAAVQPDATWIVLEEVRDPGNLGTIIRTAHAFGAGGVVLVGTCCDPFQREAVRATMGSIFAVPLVRMSREEFLAWRAGWPGDVVGTHLSARDDVRKAAARGPVLLVMGAEGAGLSESLSRSCTRLVKIPIQPGIDSLNLAVAAAVALFELRGKHLRV